MKQFKFLFYCLLAISILPACKQSVDIDRSIATSEAGEDSLIDQYPQELIDGFNAHGGLKNWKKMKSLSYSLLNDDKKEIHKVDLQNRKVNLENPDWSLGFDGKEVWVSPSKEAFGNGSPRFYHNLIFYFYAMPFVLADEGIIYEVLPKDSLNGKLYTPIKISYNVGIGDAPEDEYIAYFDAETHIMGALLYTVTYYSGNKSDKYKALIYNDWKEINGILLPASMKGFKYEDGQLGEQRYHRIFGDRELLEISYDQAMFEMPDVAEIDSLIVR